MTDNERDLPQQYLDDELDLTELVNVLWINKLFLVAWTSLFALISIIYSLTLTNIYTAETPWLQAHLVI